MEDLLNQSLMLDAALHGMKNSSEQKKRIKEFLSEHQGVEIPSSLLTSPELEWFNKSSEGLSGKIIILDFFTYCCINCIHAMPILEALDSKYSKKDVSLIGVHSAKFLNEKSSKNIQHALSRYGIFRPVVNDHSYTLWNVFAITCWPSILIIDQNLRLRKYFVGENFLKGVETFVDTLLDIPSEVSPELTLMKPLNLQGLYYPGKMSTLKGKICISDGGNHRILVFGDLPDPIVIGDGSKGFMDGPFNTTRFSSPQGVFIYDDNTIFVADTGNHLIRKISLKDASVSTILGTGEKGLDFIGGNRMRDQAISSPWDLCIGPGPKGSGEVLYIAMAGSHQIWGYGLTDTEWWKGVKREAGMGFAIAGNGREENRNNSYPHQASFAQPSGICYYEEYESIFIADSESSSIRRLNLKDGSVKNVSGGERDPTNLFAFGDVDGKGINAKLQHPLSVTPFIDGNLLVCDSYNHKLKIIGNLNDKSPNCTTFQPSVFLTLQEPSDIIYSSFDGLIYVCDTNNHQILVYNASNNELRTMDIPIINPVKSKSRIKKEDINIKFKLKSKSFQICLISKTENKRIQDGKLLEKSNFCSTSTKLDANKFIINCNTKDLSGNICILLNIMVCNSEDKTCKMTQINYILDYSVSCSAVEEEDRKEIEI
ncbi:NHL repeat-containing protein 2 [Lepeophtheirus salmonis]|uniref:NHL repeatcontaining protein 2like [Strongylocentrotus purpuratus] n=1 Tax=Lepeophtheirus salmonis TaxID=72036 RepID=A0A0K2SVT2_LEPSM|nr:NHL repeat-containing protein 2-like [Lepeophtheirus salmonis]XP_040572396.1 NHL repeat-containing protein 2-like [Lepeophtheirus salmonis]XP_040572397.1 NHL repeat-containing protein 2-like [Lepeophtheirus salmonis]XP_040572398.1 NHL repeat-containing protein 2-like [Lepeophtheirus salmonis]XP_040572399.1 NHL repeat-containing protein 2-like [Lepeophtheirus salmonis]